MALKTVGSNPTIHPTDLTPPVNKIWRSFHYQIPFRNIRIFWNIKIDNKLNIGVSSSGKTQHFDCCIRRFESCHPSQKITDTKLCLLFFCLDCLAGFEPISPSFAKQKGHINCCKRQGLPCRILPPQPKNNRHKIVSVIFLFRFSAGFEPISPSFAKQKGHINCCKRQGLPCRILPPQPRRRKLHIACGDFLSPRTHSAAPPLRNRSRLSRLFGCKRPHDGFVSLPFCFGLLLVFQMHFCICCFFV